ncbi:unnamed protein product [Rotaria magnacalcarata]|uniref:Uncharacterized protein n=7 Tax=Rotaria magnacalcarata TaxID=392030 RepID=A0A815HF18_9BILA|nr:unnamed protein product [Rotaria magnacalcarata]CAF1671737.1 unnamed protein product [Rotaria magnacalcarata]
MATGGGSGLKQAFDQFARFGKSESQLKEKDIRIESKNVQKLMKEAGVVDGKYTSQLLDNDMARVLGKLTSSGTYTKGIKTFEFQGFKQLIDQIAESKKTSADQILSLISSVSGPSTSNTTGVANANTTARMTDTSHYTGAHKERFDESGHGKGKDGRTDVVSNSGYVGEYQGAGTYDKKH